MSAEAPLRLAVFDCDGTLFDSQHLIVTCMAEACAGRGFGRPDPAAVRRVIGLPLVQAIGQLLPDAGAGDHRAVAEGYREAFHELRAESDFNEPLFAGTREVLRALDAQGVLMAVATGKGRRGLEAVLDHHGIREHFVVLKTADDGPGKPRPDILMAAMAETGVSPVHTAMIGDTVFDVKMAVSARVAAIGVAWGYHEEVELLEAGAATVINDFAALPETLSIQWGF